MRLPGCKPSKPAAAKPKSRRHTQESLMWAKNYGECVYLKVRIPRKTYIYIYVCPVTLNGFWLYLQVSKWGKPYSFKSIGKFVNTISNLSIVSKNIKQQIVWLELNWICGSNRTWFSIYERYLIYCACAEKESEFVISRYDAGLEFKCLSAYNGGSIKGLS